MSEATATNKKPLYEQRRFVFMTLDPVHIGAGGYRLGRVDNTIIREPGTNLPKIPGTSLAGAARSYAAMRYGKPAAAGQQKGLSDKQKKSKLCPILYTFGMATDGSDNGAGGSRAGSVSLGDAHLLFFPVYSMAGPLWVSTEERVKEAWGKDSIGELPEPPDDKGKTVTSLDWAGDKLNLGWLLLPTAKERLQITVPEEVRTCDEWKAISQRIVLASAKVFSQIVNSNLDVRTSVSINPETGAAEDGALFTYEAIPRAAWLWSDVVQDNYRELNSKPDEKEKNIFHQTDRQYNSETKEERKGDELGETWNSPMDVVKAGCRLIEHLGIGGMGTRGFGRMRLLGDYALKNGGAQ